MKEGRHRIILQELEHNGVVSVKKLKDMLDVTDMTIRRDLIDLEKQGLLIRVHGGAHKKVKDSLGEAGHIEKNMLNIEEKRAIAKKAAKLIVSGDTVFISSGTTTELLADYLDGKSISLVTNSLPIFERFKDNQNLDLILIGGRFHAKSQTFVGQFANRLLKDIKVSKAFIGANGINGVNVTTSNEEEGNGNAIILDNAIEKYILADSSKFDNYSFYNFYQLTDIDALVTDDKISADLKSKYGQHTKIL